MISRKKNERRKYPRIRKVLPLKVVADGYDFVATTQDISCIGTYCHVDKYIPPFTKIAVKIALPFLSRKCREGSNVECKGVVVRAEDEKRGGFNIAIFFNEIKDRQRKKISEYISRFLPK